MKLYKLFVDDHLEAKNKMTRTKYFKRQFLSDIVPVAGKLMKRALPAVMNLPQSGKSDVAPFVRSDEMCSLFTRRKAHITSVRTHHLAQPNITFRISGTHH